MIRWILAALLTLGLCLSGCTKPYTYVYYEVIRGPEGLKVGDQVRIVSKGGEIISGALVRVEGDQVTVATEADEKHKISWENIRVLERVQKARVRVD